MAQADPRLERRGDRRGGLGHLGIQILRATTAARVVAVDTRPEALALAESCGADLTVASGDDAGARIRDATPGGRGADAIFDFVGSESTMALGVAVARMIGDVIVVSIAGGTVPFSFFSIPYEVSVQTTYWGTRPELVEVLDLGARGLVRSRVTTFGLERAMDAYRAMEEARLEGRAVVVP